MDWEVKKAGKRTFTPITISITVESEDEMREFLDVITQGYGKPNHALFHDMHRAVLDMLDMAFSGQRHDDER